MFATLSEFVGNKTSERCSKPVFEATFHKEVLTHTLALCLCDSRFSLRAMQGT